MGLNQEFIFGITEEFNIVFNSAVLILIVIFLRSLPVILFSMEIFDIDCHIMQSLRTLLVNLNYVTMTQHQKILCSQ